MINKVILLGYVGADPEIRFFEGGSNLARIRVATSEKIYIRKTNETRQHTEWHTVIFWGQTATFIDKYIRKGAQVYIEGALRNRETTNKEGVKQMSVEIYGNDIKIVNQPRSQESQTQFAKQTRVDDPKQGNPKQGDMKQGDMNQGDLNQEIKREVKREKSPEIVSPPDDVDNLPF